jgi:HD-like signal output (HDOD) protein
MNELSNPAFLLQINRLKSLPALPAESLRIVAAINDPLLSTDKLANVLALSPSLVARLLGLANSAYFGQSRQVLDLPTAVYQVLGLDLVKSLALGIILNVHFNAQKCPAFDAKYFWLRSLFTAVAAQRLAAANKRHRYTPATIYTSGLLQYIGVLVLAYIMPEELDTIIKDSKKQGVSLDSEIKRHLGKSHRYVGYYLLNKWQLPEIYAFILKFYLDADYKGEERELIDLLRVAQRISALLLDKPDFELDEVLVLAEQLAISRDSISGVIDYLIDHRENIQSLADIIGHG